MPLGMIGISHHTAGVEIRDQITLNPKEQEELLKALKDQRGVHGSMVLSTCNRTEVYVSGENLEEEIDRLRSLITEIKGIDYFKNKDLTYVKTDEEMVDHFFKVIAGLDSLIVGEIQITGQVKDAYNFAHELDTTDGVLNKLFNFAMQAKKKVFSDTMLYDGTVSVSFAGVELARKIFSDLSDKKILLVGAGKTAELAAYHFMENGVKEINVVNRTFSKAEELAASLNGAAFPMEQLGEALSKVDIVISATSSEDYVITKQLLKQATAKSKGRPIFIIDLAIPRDVEPSVADIDSAYLFNLDDLEEIVQSNLEKRKGEIPKSLKIIDQYHAEFNQWMGSQSMAVVVSELKQHLEQVRLNEIERLKKNLPQNGYAKEIDSLTTNIINKIVRQHVKTLKQFPEGSADYKRHLQMIQDLIENDQ